MTNGGRVLGVVAKGENLKAARANAYKATEWIDLQTNIREMTSEKQLMKHNTLRMII